MKKIVFLIMCLCSVYANSQEGIPFFVNYPASVYQAHNRNFDVVCDSCGNVYFANFEGILHYDYNVGKLFIHRVFPVSPVCFVIRKVGYGWEDITCSDG